MLLFGTLAALALGGCQQRFTDDNLEVVNREWKRSDELAQKGIKDSGVSPKEVESILGPPKSMESRRLELETQKKEVDVVRYIYEQDGKTIELHFFDNKLIDKVPLMSSTEKNPEAKP